MYITEENCYFRKLKAKETGGVERAGRVGCLPVEDLLLSDCAERPAHGYAGSLGLSSAFITLVITGAAVTRGMQKPSS